MAEILEMDRITEEEMGVARGRLSIAVGMMMPMRDRKSRLLETLLAAMLKCCCLCLMPPNRKQHPAMARGVG